MGWTVQPITFRRYQGFVNLGFDVFLRFARIAGANAIIVWAERITLPPAPTPSIPALPRRGRTARSSAGSGSSRSIISSNASSGLRGMLADRRLDQARPLRARSRRRDVAPDADEEMLVLIAKPVARADAVLRPDEVRSYSNPHAAITSSASGSIGAVAHRNSTESGAAMDATSSALISLEGHRPDSDSRRRDPAGVARVDSNRHGGSA